MKKPKKRKPDVERGGQIQIKTDPRAKSKAWSKAQMAGLAFRVRLCGELGLQTSKQIDAIVDSKSSIEAMRDLATAASKEMAWMAGKLIELASLLESGRFQISRREGRPLSLREKRLAIAEKNVREFRREEEARKRRGEKPPQVLGSDGRSVVTLTDDLMIDAQVRNWGDDLFKRDDLDDQLAGDRASASRHKRAAKKGN
jgi:hypothetical protein